MLCRRAATDTVETGQSGGMPSHGYQIGDYLVDREGTLTGPESPVLIAELAAKRYEAK